MNSIPGALASVERKVSTFVLAADTLTQVAPANAQRIGMYANAMVEANTFGLFPGKIDTAGITANMTTGVTKNDYMYSHDGPLVCFDFWAWSHKPCVVLITELLLNGDPCCSATRGPTQASGVQWSQSIPTAVVAAAQSTSRQALQPSLTTPDVMPTVALPPLSRLTLPDIIGE